VSIDLFKNFFSAASNKIVIGFDSLQRKGCEPRFRSKKKT